MSMLIKSHPDEPDDLRAEVAVYGPGAISICLLDREGRVAGLTRLRVAGAERVAARTHLPLRIRAGEEEAYEVVPVVVYRSHDAQSIHVQGRDHADTTATRAHQLGIAQDVIEQKRAEVAVLERVYWSRTFPASLNGLTESA